MSQKERKRYTMFRHLIIPLLLLTILQASIFQMAVSSSGLISEINENSENMLNQYAQKNSAYLETEMLKKWSKIEDLNTVTIASIAHEYKNNDFSKETSFNIIENISNNFISTLRTNAVTGVYVVLCSPNEKIDNNSNFSGIYMYDDDPYHNSNTNSDIVMMRGPAEISSKLNIPLDINWSEEFYINEQKNKKYGYVFEPINAAYENISMDYSSLGYWGVIQDNLDQINKQEAITYSVPLIYEEKVYGVIGICVSLKYIISQLLSSEIMFNDSGYCIISYEQNDINDIGYKAKIIAKSDKGVLSSSVDTNEIILDRVGDSEFFYNILGVEGQTEVCAAVNEINLYKAYAPFEDTKWAVAAVTNKASLYSVTKNMSIRVGLAVAISAFLSILLTYIISKKIAKPVAELNKAVKEYSGVGTVKVIDSNIKEVYKLSKMLNEISDNLTKTQNDLVAEKERYIAALQSTNDDMMEYDPIADILVLYKFSSKNSYEQYRTVRFTNYLRQVRNGEICHIDDIEMYEKFLKGEFDERFTVRAFDNDEGYEGYSWYEISGKPIFNNNNEIVRIISSSRNVTNIKVAEFKKLDEERRHKVTNFYRLKYGEMLITKLLFEGNIEEFCLARIRIVNSDTIVADQGVYFYDAILEEIGIIINEYVAEDDVVFQVGVDEFVFFKVNMCITKMVILLEEMRIRIEKIYDNTDGEIPLKCCIGVAEFEDNIHDMEQGRFCLGISVTAAQLLTENSSHGMVAVFSDVKDNKEALAIFEKLEKEHIDKTNHSANDETITSFVLNILEKTSKFDNAMKIMLTKLGRTLNMNRIIIYDINTDFYTTSIDYQWHKNNLEPASDQILTIGKPQLDRLITLFTDEKEYIFADKDFYDISLPIVNEIINICDNGLIMFVPMFETNKYIGNVLYEFSSEIDGETKDDIIEITSILSAFISKSKTSLESRAKSDFLSRMSHEIRTPMNAIMCMTTIAQSANDVPPHVVDYFSKIERSATYLMALINDILDMSRIESGKMTVEETYLNLDEIITQLDTMIRVQIDAKNVGLIVKKSLNNIHLIGDPLKLNQVLINILGNAVKFTDSGSITFSVLEKSHDNGNKNNTHIRFSIKDTGVGIKEENLDHIFNSFEQEDMQTARKYGGTGLGLSISQNLVRMMGGVLTVQSEYGVGSEFMFTLPYRIANENEIVYEDFSSLPTNFDGKLVLLVEDDELNVEIAQTLLAIDNISIEHAENGKVAIEMFNQKPPGYYDAILMDIRMPVMDGLEATKNIRNLPREDATRIPIVAMSANAFDADMKKSVECGMNGHLSKPIDMNKVRTLLAKIWRNNK